MKIVAIAATAVALYACGKDRPPGPTEEQSAQLNEMDSALNDMAANQAVQNEEEPEANASGPSR